MKRILLALLICLLPAPCFAQGFAMLQANSVANVCDFRTGISYGVGAATCVSALPSCDGVTDDTPAFDAYATFVTSWESTHTGRLELFLPPHSTCTLTTANGDFLPMANFTLKGYTSTLFSLNGFYHMGAASQYQDFAHSVRLVTANQGDTSITVNPSAATQPVGGGACTTIANCTALFTVGKGAFMCGIDNQTGTGFPSNCGIYEFVIPTSINSTTGVITLQEPLKYTYKSTWPSFFQYATFSGCCTPDFGGPATLFALDPNWTGWREFQGLTFTVSQPSATFNGTGSTVNATFTASIGSTGTGTGSGTTLTMASVVGLISVGDTITGTGVPGGTVIASFGTGTGGNGTYITNNPTTSIAASLTLNSVVLNVTSTPSNTILPNSGVGGAQTTLTGSGVTGGTLIGGQFTGTAGGSGTYGVNNIQHVASETMTDSYSLLTTTSFVAIGSESYPPEGIIPPSGYIITGSGVPANTFAAAQLTGTATTGGTYQTNNLITSSGVPMLACCGETEWDAVGQNIRFLDTKMTNGNSFFATVSKNVVIDNNDCTPCTMELDKIVTNATINNSIWSVIFIQSQVPTNMTLNNTVVALQLGSGRNFTSNNSTIDTYVPSPSLYGQTRSIVFNNGTLNNLSTQGNRSGGTIFEGDTSAGNSLGINNQVGWTVTPGLITIPNSYFFQSTGCPSGGCPTNAAFSNPMGWAMPGEYSCWGDVQGGCYRPFQVTDVTQDATNVYVHTTDTITGFPTWSGISVLSFQAHPGLSATFTNVTGTSGEAAMLSDAAAAGLPIYSYYHRIITNTQPANALYFTMYGAIGTLEVNVPISCNYTPSGPQIMNVGPSIFSNAVNLSNMTFPTVNVMADFNVVADRKLDTSGGFPANWSGGQGTDTLTNLSSSLWQYNAIRPSWPDLTGDPTHNFCVSIKQVTNPGIVVPPY